MDDKSKRRIRSIAKRLHWLLQAILFVFFFAGFFTLYYDAVPFTDDELNQVVSTGRLVTGHSMLFTSLMEYHLSNQNMLFAYHPPRDKSTYDDWAASIEEQLDVPVAVFLRYGDSVEWLRLPDKFQVVKASAESLAMGMIEDSINCFTKQHGSVLLQTYSFELEDSTYFTLRTHDMEGYPRWGVATYFFDRWLNLAQALNDFRDKLKPNLMVSHLQGTFELEDPGKWGTRRLGLRLFNRDSLLYASPGVDTTNESYVFDSYGPIKYEVYLSDEEQRWAEIFSGRMRATMEEEWKAMDWIRWLRWVIYSFVLALFYHWILKLTKPMQAEVS